MYMIIYFVDANERCFPMTNDDGSIKLFRELIEADEYADTNDKAFNLNYRVISIEGVQE